MYKRLNYDNGEIMAVYKNTKEGIITVYEDSSISIYAFSWDQLTEKEGYKKTTKKVFDKMYNETLNKIQNLNK